MPGSWLMGGVAVGCEVFTEIAGGGLEDSGSLLRGTDYDVQVVDPQWKCK